MNCDRVFEILTRGPFPTGDASDEAVEQHLRACHDCRQLAEALRPAVELFHEAIDPNDGDGLPGYRGALKMTDYRGRSATTEAVMRQVAHLAGPREGRGTGSAVLWSWLNLGRFVAATALGAGLVLLLNALAEWNAGDPLSPPLAQAGPLPVQAAVGTAAEVPRSSEPTESGRVALARLHLPLACLSPGMTSPAPLAQGWGPPESASAHGFQCCKQCHADGAPPPAPPAWAQREASQQCFVCHRGP